MPSTELLWVAALAAGFLGSPHCLGMCGGIVTAFGMSLQQLSATQRWRLTITYHVGRLLSYASLGLLIGWVGSAALAPLAQTFWPRGLVAAVLVVIGLSMLGLPLLNALERLGLRLWQALAPLRKRLFPLNTLPRALGAGLLWGLLPCGLVYGALLLAATGGTAMSGAGLMLLFGLGTLPMLLLTGSVTQWLNQRIRRFKLRQINGVFLILAGLWTLSPLMMHGDHSQHMNHDMSQMDHSQHMNHDMSQMDHSQMNHDMSQMDHSHMNHDMSQMDHSQMNQQPTTTTSP